MYIPHEGAIITGTSYNLVPRGKSAEVQRGHSSIQCSNPPCPLSPSHHLAGLSGLGRHSPLPLYFVPCLCEVLVCVRCWCWCFLMPWVDPLPLAQGPNMAIFQLRNSQFMAKNGHFSQKGSWKWLIYSQKWPFFSPWGGELTHTLSLPSRGQKMAAFFKENGWFTAKKAIFGQNMTIFQPLGWGVDHNLTLPHPPGAKNSIFSQKYPYLDIFTF